MIVKIEFEIHESMVFAAVAFLLQCGIKPTKKKVIELCRNGLYREGGLFETEPQFDFEEPEYPLKFDFEEIESGVDMYIQKFEI